MNDYVPLPPNFLPNKFKVGDRVETMHPQSNYRGIIGKVTKTPSSTDRLAGYSARAYHISVLHAPRGNYSPGYVLHFMEEGLKEAPAPPRIEGEEIAREDVKIGDTIRTTITSEGNGYKQVSSKEGKVTKIMTNPSKTNFIFYANDTNTLNYGANNEVITLIKKGESPWTTILNGLTAGSVVVYEKSEGRTITYVKSADGFGSLSKDNWHEINNNISASSTKVPEAEVLKALEDGAEIVHKVRKHSVRPSSWLAC